ncbi:MAG: hypothetical protein IT290_07910 [Deltaproteobacteria bacterium]|nr:hypothetical protein [Deltaproteobacteria bacterium]
MTYISRNAVVNGICPADFYGSRFARLSRPNPRGWSNTRCIFHDDSTPSLGVNLQTGAFKCLACGTSGSNIIQFEIERTRGSFADVLRLLVDEWGVIV